MSGAKIKMQILAKLQESLAEYFFIIWNNQNRLHSCLQLFLLCTFTLFFLNLEFKMLYLALLIPIYFFIKTNNTDRIITLFIDLISY